MLTTRPPAAPATGPVLEAGDPGWDEARQVFNLLLDQHPAAIALPRDAEEVSAAVRYARRRGLRVSPRATGHGAAPLTGLDRTLVVDVSRMSSVTVDAPARRVRVGAGVKWMHVAPALSDLGLACLHGSSSDVGIAGYSLGGGMGWLARSHGLQCNSVTAVELVTGDGRRVRADHDHEPDLFWALRGGGGNFGVVTAIEFAVHPLRRVVAGSLFYPFARAGAVLHAWNALVPDLPDEMMTWATILHFPDIPEVPDPFRGRSLVIVMVAFVGEAPDARDLLEPLLRLGPETDTIETGPPALLGPLAMEDPAEPLPFLSAHQLVGDLPADAIDALLAVAGPDAPDPTVLTMVQLRQMGGALARRTAGAGARATLPGALSQFGLGVVEDPAAAPVVADALRRAQASLASHRVGAYGNLVESPSDARDFFDAETWDRLRRVKTAVDPDDLFRGAHHIPPAG